MPASSIPAPAPAPTAPHLPGGATIALVLWLSLASVAGASGLFRKLPFPGVQLIILGLVALTIIAGSVPGRLREWIDRLPLRALLGIHATRFIGLYFLALAARGDLNPTFAARAGWGDVATALLAIAFVASGEPKTTGRRALLHAWNAFGFLDLVVAVGTATIVPLQAQTPGVTPVLTFPLSLVPTFFVPLFLASHLFIFRRLVSGR